MLADLFLCQPMVGIISGPSMLGEFEPILGIAVEVWSLVGFGGSNHWIKRCCDKNAKNGCDLVLFLAHFLVTHKT